MELIACNTSLNNVAKFFASANKNLGQNEKDFKYVRLIMPEENWSNYKDTTLEDNVFGEITFKGFEGIKIRKINKNAFNKTADKITELFCYMCILENVPPKYDI